MSNYLLDKHMMSEITGLSEREVDNFAYIHRITKMDGEWRHALYTLFSTIGKDELRQHIKQMMSFYRKISIMESRNSTYKVSSGARTFIININ